MQSKILLSVIGFLACILGLLISMVSRNLRSSKPSIVVRNVCCSGMGIIVGIHAYRVSADHEAEATVNR